LIQSVETSLLNIAQGVAQHLLVRRRVFLLERVPAGSGLRRASYAQLIDHIEATPGSERQDLCGDLLGIVAPDQGAALDAKSLTASREEQTQVVVNFCGRGDRRTRIARGIFLANSDGGSDAGDLVDIGLLHTLQKLASVRGERLNVAALPFRVNGVKSQRRLSGTADTGDHGDSVVRNLHADVLEIVNASAANGDYVLASARVRRDEVVCRQGKPRQYVQKDAPNSTIAGDCLNFKLYGGLDLGANEVREPPGRELGLFHQVDFTNATFHFQVNRCRRLTVSVVGIFIVVVFEAVRVDRA
jgi:hypothetical protein